jgi:hypothetical protein
MTSGKTRIILIKTAIIGLFALIFLVIISLLLWYGIIHFRWTDKIIVRYKYEQSKSKDKRLLVLGDSQLEAWPLNHCLHKDMEDFCDDHDIGYINAAHYGFGPIEYRDRLEYIAGDYRPNFIVLFYYVGNDLTDVMLRNKETPRIPTHDVVFIEGKSEYQELGERVSPEFDYDLPRYKDIDPSIIELARHKSMNPYVIEMGIWQPDYLLDNNTLASARSKDTWYRILKIFEDILSLSEGINAEFFLVAIPSTVQVDTSHFDFYRKTTFHVSDQLISSAKPQKLLHDFAMASSIKYLDLLPGFKNYPQTSELYFENDDHLSEVGHQLAYHFVEKEILHCILDSNCHSYPDARDTNYYEHYYPWVVDNLVEEIRKDSNWFNLVKQKAKTRSISIDSMLYRDARYVLRKLKEKNQE